MNFFVCSFLYVSVQCWHYLNMQCYIDINHPDTDFLKFPTHFSDIQQVIWDQTMKCTVKSCRTKQFVSDNTTDLTIFRLPEVLPSHISPVCYPWGMLIWGTPTWKRDIGMSIGVPKDYVFCERPNMHKHNYSWNSLTRSWWDQRKYLELARYDTFYEHWSQIFNV